MINLLWFISFLLVLVMALLYLTGSIGLTFHKSEKHFDTLVFMTAFRHLFYLFMAIAAVMTLWYVKGIFLDL
jgi:hypothetical protein